MINLFGLLNRQVKTADNRVIQEQLNEKVP